MAVVHADRMKHNDAIDDAGSSAGGDDDGDTLMTHVVDMIRRNVDQAKRGEQPDDNHHHNDTRRIPLRKLRGPFLHFWMWKIKHSKTKPTATSPSCVLSVALVVRHVLLAFARLP